MLSSGILQACPHCAAQLIDQGEDRGEIKRWFCPKCKVKLSTAELKPVVAPQAKP